MTRSWSMGCEGSTRVCLILFLGYVASPGAWGHCTVTEFSKLFADDGEFGDRDSWA
jgi:hypothetical protein